MSQEEKMSNGEEFDLSIDENEALELYSFHHKVKKRIDTLGVCTYDRPKIEEEHEAIYPGKRAGQYFNGTLPTVIRQLSLDQLSALHTLFSNYYGYLTTHTMLVASEKSEALRKREFMLHHLKNFYRRPNPKTGKKVAESSVGDYAKSDHRYVTLDAAYQEVAAYFTILEAMRSVAYKDMQVISREVTIHYEKFRQEILGQNFRNRGRDDDFGEYYEPANDPGRSAYKPPRPVPRVNPK